MMMTAVGVIPLLAMIGGAVDASRIYMSYARLQQACDAGALAGRKAMANVTALTATEQAKANEFFDFNFPTDTYAGQNITRTFVKGADGVVVGNASVTMPTTIMKMFGFTTVPVTVSCQATLNIPNTDVMFVLDVTGSMAWKPDGTSTSNVTESRMYGLKQAVKDFYAALGPGSGTGPGRVRYGFMPYNSTVNVGRSLFALNPAYLIGGLGAENWSYQSRRAVEVTDRDPSYGSESAQNYGAPSEDYWGGSWTPSSGAVGSFPATTNDGATACRQRAKPDTTPAGFGAPVLSSSETVTYPDNQQTLYYTSSFTANGRTYKYDVNSKNGKCQLYYADTKVTRTRDSTTTRPVTWSDPYKRFSYWSYEQRNDIDVSPFVRSTAGSEVANPVYYRGRTKNNVDVNRLAPQTFRWAGCIEEAQTINTIVPSTPLERPSGADDLDIDLRPTSGNARWKPFLDTIQYQRDTTWMNGSGCPAAASPLTMYASDYDPVNKASASFNTYVDSLFPNGGTYHDIGLIWGARFLSQDGIFGSTNSDAAAPGGYAVSRHLVFMTDGALSTYNDLADAWGINLLDGRIASTSASNTNLNDSHGRRAEIICNAMKGKGFTIWIIGFGSTPLSQTLKDCATDTEHWSEATNTAQLRQRFAQIAQTIGGLRLSS